ncbi:TPA: 30S ribosomal protein S21 [Candidatus Poribacteria bacterium]|nr:30S ribosomal protein S21 [Candidatus Poribacteria bacterium]
MLEVKVKKDESIDKALRRFKKQCDKEELIKEMKKRERYEKPSERRRKKYLKSQRKGKSLE